MAVRRCDDQAYVLDELVTGAGASNPVTIPGGEYMFMSNGTFGGSNVSLQFQAPNGVWGDIYVFSGSPIRSTTSPYNQTGIDLPAGNVRLNLSGGTPVNVNAYLVGLG